MRFAGLEIAPDPASFAPMWTALVCFAYGVAAWQAEPTAPTAVPYQARGLAELRGALDRSRSTHLTEVTGWLADVPAGPIDLQEEDRYLDLRLSILTGPHLAGQIVTDHDRTVYASLFAW